MLRLKKEEVITESVIDQKRSNVLQFAAQKAIAIDRQAIDRLTLDQIAGLGDAARGSTPGLCRGGQGARPRDRARSSDGNGKTGRGALGEPPGTHEPAPRIDSSTGRSRASGGPASDHKRTGKK
jgi:hypothetical protein